MQQGADNEDTKRKLFEDSKLIQTVWGILCRPQCLCGECFTLLFKSGT